jgi:O-antigen/teichoic acid export membrane protein
VFCGLEYLLAKPLCQQLYGSQDAGRYLQLYALLIPMLYCDAITDAMTKGLGQQKICVRYNILTSFLDLVFLYFLLPVHSMMGYYVSFLVTHLLNFILSLRRLMKITEEKLPLHVPIRAAGSAVFSIQICSLTGSDVARGICYPLILGSLLFLLRILDAADLRWISGLIRKKDPTNR